jgi:hypothetical protein
MLLQRQIPVCLRYYLIYSFFSVVFILFFNVRVIVTPNKHVNFMQLNQNVGMRVLIIAENQGHEFFKLQTMWKFKAIMALWNILAVVS